MTPLLLSGVQGPQIPVQSRGAPPVPPHRQSQVVTLGRGGGWWVEAEKRAGRPVDMFRRNSSRGAGAGRVPGLSHSCWVYQRGIVPRQEEPAARGWALGCCTAGSRLPDQLLSQGPCQLHFPSSRPISLEVTPALSWQCRAEAWRQTKRSRDMEGVAWEEVECPGARGREATSQREGHLGDPHKKRTQRFLL